MRLEERAGRWDPEPGDWRELRQPGRGGWLCCAPVGPGTAGGGVPEGARPSRGSQGGDPCDLEVGQGTVALGGGESLGHSQVPRRGGGDSPQSSSDSGMARGPRQRQEDQPRRAGKAGDVQTQRVWVCPGGRTGTGRVSEQHHVRGTGSRALGRQACRGGRRVREAWRSARRGRARGASPPRREGGTGAPPKPHTGGGRHSEH